MTSMRPLIALLVAAIAACALAPAAASAAPHRHGGVVLSASHGNARLVDRAHRVSRVRLRAAGLHRGDVVAVHGRRARVTGHVARVAFRGRVLRASAHGAVLRLGDGAAFRLSVDRGARATAVSTDPGSLTRGETVLVTLASDVDGNVALALEPCEHGGGDERRGAGKRGNDGGERGDDGDQGDEGDPGDDGDTLDEVDGTVTAIADDLSSITVDPGDGDLAVTIPVDDPELLDGIEIGDDVAVFVDRDGIATEIDLSENPGADDT